MVISPVDTPLFLFFHAVAGRRRFAPGATIPVREALLATTITLCLWFGASRVGARCPVVSYQVLWAQKIRTGYNYLFVDDVRASRFDRKIGSQLSMISSFPKRRISLSFYIHTLTCSLFFFFFFGSLLREMRVSGYKKIDHAPCADFPILARGDGGRHRDYKGKGGVAAFAMDWCHVGSLSGAPRPGHRHVIAVRGKASDDTVNWSRPCRAVAVAPMSDREYTRARRADGVPRPLAEFSLFEAARFKCLHSDRVVLVAALSPHMHPQGGSVERWHCRHGRARPLALISLADC